MWYVICYVICDMWYAICDMRYVICDMRYVICEAVRHTHYWGLAASTPSFLHACDVTVTVRFLSWLRSSTRSFKQKRDAIYRGNHHQLCLAALVESRSLWNNDPINGMFQDGGLGFQRDSPREPASLVLFYLQDTMEFFSLPRGQFHL